MPETAADPFADLATEIGRSERTLETSRGQDLEAARGAWSEISKRVQQGYRGMAEAEKPAIEAAQKVAAQPMPKPPKGPVLAPAPSLGLRAFLSPVQGESPEASIGKFFQSLGLMATSIGGMAKGSARASIAAMTGALKGWQEGDKERADRAFGDWKTETDRLLTNYQTERQSYLDLMQDKNLTLQQMLMGVQLAARAAGNDMLADLAAKGDQEAVIKRLEADRNHFDQVRTNMLRIEEMAQSKRQHDEMQATLVREKIQADTERAREKMEAQRERDKENADLRRELAGAQQATALQIAQLRVDAQKERGDTLKPAQAIKLQQQDVGITQKLGQRERLKAAVEALDKAGVIPKGPTKADQAKAWLNLQRRIGDQEIAKNVEALNRWGTALLVSSEISTAGAASVFRIKSIAEKEAGNVQWVPKAFWDDFLSDSERILKDQQANIRKMLGTEAAGTGAPETGRTIDWKDIK